MSERLSAESDLGSSSRDFRSTYQSFSKVNKIMMLPEAEIGHRTFLPGAVGVRQRSQRAKETKDNGKKYPDGIVLLLLSCDSRK
jgi:hypothetical protein